MVSEERLQILDMIANGKITAEQGVDLLRALDEEADLPPELVAESQSTADDEEQPPVEAIRSETVPVIVEATSAASTFKTATSEEMPSGDRAQSQSYESLPETPSFDPQAAKWRGWWRFPLWIGVIATILSGLLMYSIYNASGFGFWFACSWFPFMISVAIIALAWWSSNAHWLHVRVHQKPGERPQKIAISLPIPIGLMAWFLRMFRSKIPNIDKVNPEEMILAINHVTPEKPFYVQVDEEDGERVEVYIG